MENETIFQCRKIQSSLLILETNRIEYELDIKESQVWINDTKIGGVTSGAFTVLNNDTESETQRIQLAIYIPIEFRNSPVNSIVLRTKSNSRILFGGEFAFDSNAHKFYALGTNEIQKNNNYSPGHVADPDTGAQNALKNEVVIFTIASTNYLAYVRVLFSSIKQFHPTIKLVLCLVDRISNVFNPQDELFDVVESEYIGIPSFLDMTARYDIMELNTAVKPFMFEWIFNNYDSRKVIYFDPDIQVYSSLTNLIEKMDETTSVILTPHVNNPYPENLNPNDLDIMRAGVFNLGFIAIKKCSESLRYLNWWSSKLATTCIVDLKNGLFVDQKWCDFAPCFLPNLFILRDPGYNVAYWNLFERTIYKDNNKWYSSGSPLVFFHFSGVDTSKPQQISKHQNRHSMTQIGECSELYQNYFQRLIECSHLTAKSLSYTYNYFGNNYEFNRIVKILYRETFDSPVMWNTQSELIISIIELCNSGGANYSLDTKPGLTRLFNRIYKVRPDLAGAFDLQQADCFQRLVQWFENEGRQQYDIDARLVVTPSAGVNETLYGQPKSADLRRNKYFNRLMEIVYNSRDDLQKAFPLNDESSVNLYLSWWKEVAKNNYPLCVESNAQRNSGVSTMQSRLPLGVNLVGYVKAEMGMGEHVRSSISASRAVSLNHSIINFEVGVKARLDAELEIVHSNNLINNFNVNVFHINADQMLETHLNLGSDFFSSRYNIGYWLWELASFPEAWCDSFDFVDEVWAPSRFIQKAISEKTSKPVIYMPLCVGLPETLPHFSRSHFGLPDDGFIFLLVFDFHSFFDRKNPVAAVNAFIDAFSKNGSNIYLVVKTMNVDLGSDKWLQFYDLILKHKNIVLINKTLRKSEVLSLIKCSDCYVSTHRSEGFGYGPAEAMLLGRPVILTNYSSTTDFADDSNSFPVEYSLIPVGSNEYPMSSGQLWADPSVEHCSYQMKMVYNDYGLAITKAERAKQLINKNNSAQSVGARYKTRIGMINKLHFS